MDILGILRLLRRQIWVVSATSVLAAALLVLTVIEAPPQYRASASVVLLNPPAATDVAAKLDPSSEAARKFQNPYARFNDLSVVVDIVRRRLTSQQADDTLRGNGLVGLYTVAANIDFYRGPIIDIAGEAPTEADAVKSTNLVVDQLKVTLQELQAAQGTDPTYFITSAEVVPATKATRVISSTLRRVIAVGGVLGFLVLGSAVGTDYLRFGRRKRAEARGQALGAGDQAQQSAYGPPAALSRVNGDDAPGLSLVDPDQFRRAR